MARFALAPKALVLALLLAACKSSAKSEPDAAPAPSAPSAPSGKASAPPETPSAAPAPATLAGDWERVTEPYGGLVIRIGASGDVLEGTVLTPSRRMETPALACQASLWRAGEHYLKLRENQGTIVVRDWGLTAGVCRHADAKAKVEARLDAANLVLAVTRNGAKAPVEQRWKRSTASTP